MVLAFTARNAMNAPVHAAALPQSNQGAPCVDDRGANNLPHRSRHSFLIKLSARSSLMRRGAEANCEGGGGAGVGLDLYVSAERSSGHRDLRGLRHRQLAGSLDDARAAVGAGSER